jgi:hypothetical protein
METRNIKLDIATAERWLQGDNQELKDLAIQTFPELSKKKLPKTWEELEKVCGWFDTGDSVVVKSDVCKTKPTNKNIFATKEQAEASIALAQLSQLREVYRNGWKPEKGVDIHVIAFYENKIATTVYLYGDIFLSVQSIEVRDEFLENFRELIEQAKPLMS